MGVKFPGKKRYVTLEWPIDTLLHNIIFLFSINQVSDRSTIFGVADTD